MKIVINNNSNNNDNNKKKKLKQNQDKKDIILKNYQWNIKKKLQKLQIYHSNKIRTKNNTSKTLKILIKINKITKNNQ